MKIGYKQSTAEGLVTALNGAAQGAENYARGKRYREARADENKQADRRYSLALSEDARRGEEQKRAAAEEDRRAQEFPIRKRILENQAHAGEQQNAQEDAYAQHQQTEDEYARQVEIDSHRQEQAQEYKRVTGKDVPPDYWEKDSQGHKPGEMGWHWTMYDPKSDIPIKTQIQFNKAASELSTLPPDATRAERAAALRRDTQAAIVSQAKQSVLDEVGQHVQPEQKPGADPSEADPLAFVPPETFKKLQELAQDPTTSPDEMRRAWKQVQDSHSEEMAHLESRTIALNALDAHAAKMAQMQQDYGSELGQTSSEDFERFRKARYDIAKSKLHGALLDDAVRDAKALLTPGPKPKKDPLNDKTGFNAGDAIKMAAQELAANPQYIQADDATKNAMLQKRAGDFMRMTQGLAGGDMPGASSAKPGPGPNGGYPNPLAQQPQPQADPSALAQKAKAAGWTREEFIRFGQSGEQPRGKPPIQ